MQMRSQVANPQLAMIAVAAALLGRALSPAPVLGQEAGHGLKDAARAFARKQVEASFRAMNRPFPPFRIIGNVYYVGASDVASYLIKTSDGHIVINSGFEDTVPLIRDSMKTLGFRFEDIKILLNSHAHVDHAGGHAALRTETGASILMSEADAALLARGGRGDVLPASDEIVAYPAARADRIIRDGEVVTLGGVSLTAHLTPGHTAGCTTWTMKVEDGGRALDVVFLGGATLLPGVRLLDNPKYPEIATDYERTFRVLEELPCDVFLAPHGFQFGLKSKAARLSAGTTPSPFIDPEGYRLFVSESDGAFRRALERERRAVAAKGKDF